MLCWMAVIFMFSAEPDTESSELSGSVIIDLYIRLDTLFVMRRSCSIRQSL